MFKWLFVLLILGVSLVDAMPCTVPRDTMVIKETMLLCEGDYFLPNGFSLNSDLTLDCGDSFIYGEDREGVGITVLSQQNVHILNCNLGFYENGIYSEDSSNISIDHSFFEENYIGAELFNVSFSSIRDVTVHTQALNGIVIVGDHNLIRNSQFVYSEQSLLSVYGKSNKIYNNSFENGNKGLVVKGISNYIIDNRFLENRIGAENYGKNVWSLRDHGNYWDTYLGEDSDGDCVGDHPFIIFYLGVDYAPRVCL